MSQSLPQPTWLGVAVPVNDTEIAAFYWTTDCKTPDIAEAFGFTGSTNSLSLFVGPALLPLNCSICDAQILAKSRAHATSIIGYYRRGTLPCCRGCEAERQRLRDVEWAQQQDGLKQRRTTLRTMPYRDFLQTPEWKHTRQQALKRAGFKCQTCAAGGRLNVHHRTYARRGSEAPADLIVLCEPCHSVFHERRVLAEGGRAA